VRELLRVCPRFPITVRRKAYDETNYTCEECGFEFRKRGSGKGVQGVEPHHKLPESMGGSNKRENLVVLCGPEGRDCHEKYDKLAIDQGILWGGYTLRTVPKEWIGDMRLYCRALRIKLTP
jgi:hypothetical protein